MGSLIQGYKMKDKKMHYRRSKQARNTWTVDNGQCLKLALLLCLLCFPGVWSQSVTIGKLSFQFCNYLKIVFFK